MRINRLNRAYHTAFALLLLAAIITTNADAADWPQWRGPARNGISSESGWLSQWPPTGPRRAWSVKVGDGYASVAVVGGRVYTTGNTNDQDMVYCLNATNGATIWKYSYTCPSGDPSGTRATPVVSGTLVYTLSSQGFAVCLNAATGKLVWRRNLARETGAQMPQWGFSGSPTVDGNLVYYNVGASGMALDKNTGKPMWNSGAGLAGYSTPVPYTVGAQQGLAIFSGSGIVAVNPRDGRPLWQYPWQTSYNVNAADPIFSGDTVFISSNYNKGCALLKVGPRGPSVVWQNRNMRNHFNSCVLLGGALYGNDENTLKCIDLKTGAERWASRGMGKGGVIAADGKLIALTERGELIIVAADPARYREIARAQVLRGTCWTQPALVNGFIYCRSHEGDLVCLDVTARRAGPRGAALRP